MTAVNPREDDELASIHMDLLEAAGTNPTLLSLAKRVNDVRVRRAWPKHSRLDGPDGSGYPSFAEPFGDAS